MRTRLDHNHSEPVRFETHSRKPATVVIRVEFKSDGDAEASRLTFGTGAAETHASHRVVARTLPCEWALACVVSVGPRKNGGSGGTAVRALPSSVDRRCLSRLGQAYLGTWRHRHEGTFLGHAGVDSNARP